MATYSTFGHINEFQPEVESFSTYRERLTCFMEANNIEDGRKVAVLLSVIGTKYFSLIHSLVAPVKPKDKTLKELLDTLEAHLDPPPVFYLRDSTSNSDHKGSRSQLNFL